MTFQLSLPDEHCRNITEKYIQTWKYHFIGFMSSTATTFPLHLWCQAIPQSERQLILLQKSNVNPAISAYTHLYGPHYYNAEPFLPIGMKTLVHDKPHRRKTFVEHCRKGHVNGTSFITTAPGSCGWNKRKPHGFQAPCSINISTSPILMWHHITESL